MALQGATGLDVFKAESVPDVNGRPFAVAAEVGLTVKPVAPSIFQKVAVLAKEEEIVGAAIGTLQSPTLSEAVSSEEFSSDCSARPAADPSSPSDLTGQYPSPLGFVDEKFRTSIVRDNSDMSALMKAGITWQRSNGSIPSIPSPVPSSPSSNSSEMGLFKELKKETPLEVTASPLPATFSDYSAHQAVTDWSSSMGAVVASQPQPYICDSQLTSGLTSPVTADNASHTAWADATPVLPATHPRVLCCGDSLTAGFYGDRSNYFSFGKILMNELGVPVDENGLSGLRADELLANIDNPFCTDIFGRQAPGLRAQLTRHKYTVCVIMAGINDISVDRRPDEILRDVIALHTICHQLGVRTVALPILQYLHLLQPQGHCHAMVQQAFNFGLQQWAATQPGRVAFVDMANMLPWSEFTGDWAFDGLHLSMQGYARFGSLLSPCVKQYILSEGVQFEGIPQANEAILYTRTTSETTQAVVVGPSPKGPEYIALDYRINGQWMRNLGAPLAAVRRLSLQAEPQGSLGNGIPPSRLDTVCEGGLQSFESAAVHSHRRVYGSTPALHLTATCERSG